VPEKPWAAPQENPTERAIRTMKTTIAPFVGPEKLGREVDGD